jgi:putative membrane protein
MSHLPATIFSIGLLLAIPASAQIGNPAGMKPGTPESAPGIPAPHQLNTQDRLFIMLVGAGGLAEVEFGRLAQEKAQNPAVKNFARRMVEDHEAANEQLSSLAEAAGVTPPKELDPEHKAMRGQLQKLSGRQFDFAYMQGQVQDHQKTVQILEWELGSGQDPALKNFAAKPLPKIYDHLRMAQSVQADLTGQAPPRIAANSPPASGKAQR